MKIGFVGCGKLGMPCALAAASRGHDVVGFDADTRPYDIVAWKKYPYREAGAQELLDKTTFRMVLSLESVVEHAEIVFVAVQTPHRPEYEGLTRMPKERADFDYTALCAAVGDVARIAHEKRKPTTIVVISTCLPGTSRRDLYPLLNEHTGFIYNPFFIAMGTTIADYLNPEFVLLGYDPEVDKIDSLERVQKFYRELHEHIIVDTPAKDLILPPVMARHVPHAVMSVPSAEATKVFYNTAITSKINLANTWMEICHKIPGANVDDVTRALALATDRVVSPKYMTGGMGDGGGCHPRDLIALSWLADELDLSSDVFGDMVYTRERQSEWLGDLCCLEAKRAGDLPIVILGKAYKPESNLTYGSPAILLKNILDEWGATATQWDPHVDETPFQLTPAVFFIGTKHDEFFKMQFPEGSVVIDPWRKMPDQVGVKVIRIGLGAGADS